MNTRAKNNSKILGPKKGHLAATSEVAGEGHVSNAAGAPARAPRWACLVSDRCMCSSGVRLGACVCGRLPACVEVRSFPKSVGCPRTRVWLSAGVRAGVFASACVCGVSSYVPGCVLARTHTFVLSSNRLGCSTAYDRALDLPLEKKWIFLKQDLQPSRVV